MSFHLRHILLPSLLLTGCQAFCDPCECGDTGGSADTADTGPGGDAGCSADPEDDTFTGAVSADYEGEVEGCFSDSDDLDYYLYTVPDDAGGGVFQVVLQTTADSNPSLGLYDETQQNLVNSYNATAGSQAIAWVAAAPGASFYAAASAWNQHQGDAAYTLTATWWAIGDPYEPDDTIEEAPAMTLGSPFEGRYFFSWHDAADHELLDIASIELEPGDYAFSTTSVPADAEPEMSLLDGEGNQVEYTYTATSGGGVTVEHSVEETGTYYLSVADWMTNDTTGNADSFPETFSETYTVLVEAR